MGRFGWFLFFYFFSLFYFYFLHQARYIFSCLVGLFMHKLLDGCRKNPWNVWFHAEWGFVFSWFALFSPQTPRVALCDCGGQSSAWDVSFWRHDAGRQRSARPAASGPAEEAQLRRPDKHPVYLSNCALLLTETQRKRFCSLLHTDKTFPYIIIITFWHEASILGNFILKNAKMVVTKPVR